MTRHITKFYVPDITHCDLMTPSGDMCTFVKFLDDTKSWHESLMTYQQKNGPLFILYRGIIDYNGASFTNMITFNPSMEK